MVPAELHHIHTITKKKIVPPTRDEVNEAFAHYGMKCGANEDVVGVITALAKEAVENKDLPAIRFYLHMQHGLTNDPEIKFAALPDGVTPVTRLTASGLQ